MEVLVVDDHPLTLEMLPEVLRGVFPGAIVHTAADLAGALGIARRERSLDYILLDLGLPDCKGLEGLTRIRQEFPRVRVVVVSASEESETILGALKAGAAGYIPKTEKTRVLAAALQLIAAGGIYVPDSAKEKPQRGIIQGIGKKVESVKVGDQVLFDKYSGSKLRIEDEECLILKEEDILGIFTS